MRYAIFIVLALGSMSFASASGTHDGGHGHEQDSNKASAHWMSPDEELARVNPVKRDDDSISRGTTLYNKYCASCHGSDARGNGPAGSALNPKPADLRQMSGGHPDGDFSWKIANGRGTMPAWKNILSENQIWDLVNYIQSLSLTKKSSEEEKHQDDHAH